MSSFTQYTSAYDPLTMSGDEIDSSFSFASDEAQPLPAARAPIDAAATAPAAPLGVEANQPASYYVRLLAKQAAADDANGRREIPFIASRADADGEGRVPVGIVIGNSAPLTEAQEQEIRAAVAAVGSGENLPVNVTPLFDIGAEEEEEAPRTWRQKARRRWRRAKVWARANGPDILRVIAVAGVIIVVVGVTVASPFAAIILAGVAFGALAAAEIIAAMRAKYYA